MKIKKKYVKEQDFCSVNSGQNECKILYHLALDRNRTKSHNLLIILDCRARRSGLYYADSISFYSLLNCAGG